MSPVSRQREWQLRNPEKSLAQRLAQQAIKRGTLVRPPTCSRCPNPNPHAHHEDYARPLDVTWLCKFCHARRHADLRDPEREAKRAARKEQRQREAERRALKRRMGRTISAVESISSWIPEHYTDGDLLAALRELADDGYISRKMYLERRQACHPSLSMFDIRYGTWLEAAAAAGLRCGPRRRTYERMSDEKLIDDIRLVVAATPWLPSVTEYSRFREAHPEHGMACSALVRRRLGGWAVCLRMALDDAELRDVAA